MQKSINELKENMGDVEKANSLNASGWKATKSVVDELQKQFIQAEKEKNALRKQLDEAIENKHNEIHCTCGTSVQHHNTTEANIALVQKFDRNWDKIKKNFN